MQKWHRLRLSPCRLPWYPGSRTSRVMYMQNDQGKIWRGTMHHGFSLSCQIWSWSGKGRVHYKSPQTWKFGKTAVFRRSFTPHKWRYILIKRNFALGEYIIRSLPHAPLSWGVAGHPADVGATVSRCLQFLVCFIIIIIIIIIII